MRNDGVMQAIKTLARSAGKGFVSEAHKQGVMFSWDKVPSARKLKTAFLCCLKNLRTLCCGSQILSLFF
jgi:hypothetical protein